MQKQVIEYAELKTRFTAFVFDCIFIVIAAAFLIIIFYGSDFIFGKNGLVARPVYAIVLYLLPPLYIIGSWTLLQATPGMNIMYLKMVDEKTSGPILFPQAVIRFFAYFIAAMPCFAGIIWAIYDEKNRCWHDRLAHTIVIKNNQWGM